MALSSTSQALVWVSQGHLGSLLNPHPLGSGTRGVSPTCIPFLLISGGVSFLLSITTFMNYFKPTTKYKNSVTNTHVPITLNYRY